MALVTDLAFVAHLLVDVVGFFVWFRLTTHLPWRNRWGSLSLAIALFADCHIRLYSFTAVRASYETLVTATVIALWLKCGLVYLGWRIQRRLTARLLAH